MARSIFDFESEDRVESPERLNEYIRVATPGVWVMVLALLLVLAALIIWSFVGRIPRTISLKGGVYPYKAYKETQLYSLVDPTKIYALVDPTKYDPQQLLGKKVEFSFPSGEQGQGKIDYVDALPLSREEVAQLLQSDFLTNAMVPADYSVTLTADPDVDLSGDRLEVGELTVVVDEVPPISFLLN